RVTRTPQDLLSLFIAELRMRAELGVNYLPVESYSQLGLDLGTQVTLNGAVFSHPVDMPDEARHALMEAAHRAGINELMVEVDDFFEQSCVDEATAAVLAYVQGRVQVPPLLDALPADRERVLCFDMGGGTTDLAAVEVLGMASFLASQSGDVQVVVNLEAKNGERFGGDDLDELLAFSLLDEVRRQSEERGAPVLLEDLKRAIKARSLWDFKSDYERRHGAEGGTASRPEVAGRDAGLEDQALGIYKRAALLLAQSEAAKRALSSAPDFEPIHLPGDGWPREGPDERAATLDFEVQLHRGDFEAKVREEVSALLHLLDKVVAGAGWEWPSVTTLLLTGQATRMQAIREEVVRHVEQRRGSETPPLLRIEPGHPNFDPKNCVAIGAAIWGANRNDGSWLEIRNRVHERLTFDLATKVGPRWRAVRGLQQGQALPASGVVPIQKGTSELKLYRNGNRDPYVRFRFPPTREASELTVRVDGPSNYTVVVGGQEIKGEVRS
nr:Hsp70 family protein [Acidobacteriota bacterium]